MKVLFVKKREYIPSGGNIDLFAVLSVAENEVGGLFE